MKALPWVGKIAAVLSALFLAGGYVASRAVPGLLHSVQVFGGEGGGQGLPAQGDSQASPASDPALLGSTKSAGGVFRPKDVKRSDRTAVSQSAAKPTAAMVLPSSKSGPIFGTTVIAGTFAVSPTPPALQPPRRVTLSDGTVIEVPAAPPVAPSRQDGQQRPRAKANSANPAPNSQAPPSQPQQRQQIMPGSKSAAVF